MNRLRGGLLLVYVLAATLAQGLHDHGMHPAADAVALAAQPGCDDSRPHYAGHGGPDLSQSTDLCPACQFLSTPGALATEPAFRQIPIVSGLDRAATPAATFRLDLRPTGRAPPRA